MDPGIQRQIKRGVAGMANIVQASCGQLQSGNCISEYCHRILHLSDLELFCWAIDHSLNSNV